MAYTLVWIQICAFKINSQPLVLVKTNPRTHSMQGGNDPLHRWLRQTKWNIYIGERGGAVPQRTWYSTELVMCAPQPIMMCCVLCSWPHSGAAGAAGEVPGGPEEARPARGGTRAVDGYLPAFSRYCRSDSAEEGTYRGVIMNCSWVISLAYFFPPTQNIFIMAFIMAKDQL